MIHDPKGKVSEVDRNGKEGSYGQKRRKEIACPKHFF